MSNIQKDGRVLIISLHDDDRFIQLSGDMAEVWQRIDGKRNWKEILDSEYRTEEETQSIHKIISQILKNNWRSIEYTTRNENIQINTLGKIQPASEIHADAYDDNMAMSHTSYGTGGSDGSGPNTGLLNTVSTSHDDIHHLSPGSIGYYIDAELPSILW